MGQVSISALRAVTLPEAISGVSPQEDRARTQGVVAAVQVLNQAGIAGTDREVTISTNSVTRRPVVRVVDRQSGEVIVQWPSEYAIRLAEEYKRENPNK